MTSVAQMSSVISSDAVSESSDEESPVKPSVGVFLTEQTSPGPKSKIVVRPGVEQHFRPEDRRLTFRYISNAEFYTNRIFKQSRDSMLVLKGIARSSTRSSTQNGAIKTKKLPSILHDAGLTAMNPEIQNNASKLTQQLLKAHGSELSMMVCLGLGGTGLLQDRVSETRALNALKCIVCSHFLEVLFVEIRDEGFRCVHSFYFVRFSVV